MHSERASETLSTMDDPNPLCAREAEGYLSRPVPATPTSTSDGSPVDNARDVSRRDVNDDKPQHQQVLHVRRTLARVTAMHVHLPPPITRTMRVSRLFNIDQSQQALSCFSAG